MCPPLYFSLTVWQHHISVLTLVCHPFRKDTLHCFREMDSDLLRNQSGETCFAWCLTPAIATLYSLSVQFLISKVTTWET